MNPEDSDEKMVFGELKDTNPYSQFMGDSVPGGSPPAKLPTPGSPLDSTGYPQPNYPATEGGYPPAMYPSGYPVYPVTYIPPEPPPGKPEYPPPSSTPGGKAISGFCFLVIFSVIAIILILQNFVVPEGTEGTPEGELANLVLQGKVALGVKAMGDNNPEFGEEQQESFPFGQFGSVRNRQAGAVMTSELESAGDGLVVLAAMEKQAAAVNYEFNEVELQNTETLRQLFSGFPPDQLSESQRLNLEKELLWFGELALHPESGDTTNPQRQALLSNAKSTFVALVCVVVAGMLALIAGVIGLIVFAILYTVEKINIRTRWYSRESTIYLESFTIWLLTFMGSSLLFGWLAPEQNPLVGNLLLFLLSLVTCLCWPVFRGKWSKEFRQDLGFCGNPVREMLVGAWCYICGLPILLAGFICTLIFLSAAAPVMTEDDLSATGPGHPLLEWVMQGDVATLILVYLVACVCAPVVEETVFRGFFYRALRDNSHFLGPFLSMLFAAFVNGLVFAAIHPQGIYFIPVLCSLGMAFSFAREWRGSLWAPMTMHAIHNGILTTVLVFSIV